MGLALHLLLQITTKETPVLNKMGQCDYIVRASVLVHWMRFGLKSRGEIEFCRFDWHLV